MSTSNEVGVKDRHHWESPAPTLTKKATISTLFLDPCSPRAPDTPHKQMLSIQPANKDAIEMYIYILTGEFASVNAHTP